MKYFICGYVNYNLTRYCVQLFVICLQEFAVSFLIFRLLSILQKLVKLLM